MFFSSTARQPQCKVMQESKYKTDIGGAILRGAGIEKPTDLAPSHFSPFLMVRKSPPQNLSG